MLSEELIKKINELYSLGVNKTNISKQLHISIPTVTKYIKNPIQKESMIGKKFGRLTVLEIAPKNKNLKSRCIRYKCQCDCGKIIEVNGNSLRTGHTQSCGCFKKEGPIKDLTGKRFYKLLVLEDTGKRKDRCVIWKCKCDCGNTCEVSSKYLLNGDTGSCGCLKSKQETFIKQILDNNGIKYQQEYTFNNLISNNGGHLRYDFAIFNKEQLLCLIEYNGIQHYQPIETFGGEKRFQNQLNNDNLKKQYCKENNIPLLIYSYDENLSERRLLDDITRAMPRNN